MIRRPLSSLRLVAASASLVLAAATACGGGQKTDDNPPTDDLDEASTKPVDSMGDRTTPGDGDETDPSIDGDGDGDGDGAVDPVADGPAVTFRIKNTWTEDLEFNLDAGWGAQILVFSGKPPKAVSILPFETYCTASCDAEASDRCPVCKKPEALGAIRKAEKRETVEPQKELEVSWDGQVHVYEKTKAKGKKCDCHRLAPTPEGSYTVRVCGLRLSKKHREHSKLQCVDLVDVLAFPADGPQVVDVDFGNPTPKKKKK